MMSSNNTYAESPAATPLAAARRQKTRDLICMVVDRKFRYCRSERKLTSMNGHSIIDIVWKLLLSDQHVKAREIRE